MGSAVVLNVLSSTSLFGGLTLDQLVQVQKLASERQFEPEELIISADSTEAVGMWIILDGHAEVRVGDTVVHTFGVGDYFGELALLLPKSTSRSADVIAVEPLTAAELSREAVLDLVSGMPDVAMAMLSELAQRLRQTDRLVRELEGQSSAQDAEVPDNALMDGDDLRLLTPIQYTLARGSPPISHVGPQAED